MHASLLVSAAALISCFVPTTVMAQSGAGSEDLRTEIRRIVREEIRAAMREMRAAETRGAPQALPGAPARPGSGAPPRVVLHDVTEARAAEKVKVEVEEMGVLLQQIEREVAKGEQNLRRLASKKSEARKADVESTKKARAGGEGIQFELGELQFGGEGLQVQLGEGGEGLHLQLGDGAEVHTFVIEDGKLKAVGGDVRKTRAVKAGQPIQVELRESQPKAKAAAGEPVEMRIEGFHLRLQGDDEGGAIMLQGHPATGKSGCSCNCPCCGGGAHAATGKGKASQPQVMFLGAPAHGEAVKGKMQVRAKAGDDDDDDDDDEGEEARKVEPPKKAGAVKPKAGQVFFIGGSERGEAGKGRVWVRTEGEEEEEEEEAEERQVAPPKPANPAPAATPAKARVIRLGKLLV